MSKKALGMLVCLPLIFQNSRMKPGGKGLVILTCLTIQHAKEFLSTLFGVDNCLCFEHRFSYLLELGNSTSTCIQLLKLMLLRAGLLHSESCNISCTTLPRFGGFPCISHYKTTTPFQRGSVYVEANFTNTLSMIPISLLIQLCVLE